MYKTKNRDLVLFSAITSALIFSALLTLVVLKAPILAFDELTGNFIRLAISAEAVGIMLVVTNIASPLPIVVLSVFMYFALVWKRHGFYDLIFISAFFLGIFLTTFFKWILDVERPISNLVPAFDASFPSGHTTMATIFFLVLAYAFRHEIKSIILLWFFEIICFAGIVLIAVSRIYLGAHRPSETVAGFLLGTFCFTVSLLIFRHLENKNVQSAVKM